ncbi:hypothetical protein DMB44_03190 [Thermoplasma sp. Kam2015]|nr:hypothetical protein DMB44_03190 [Thermoplasma sp. Kam2015]
MNDSDRIALDVEIYDMKTATWYVIGVFNPSDPDGEVINRSDFIYRNYKNGYERICICELKHANVYMYASPYATSLLLIYYLLMRMYTHKDYMSYICIGHVIFYIIYV